MFCRGGEAGCETRGHLGRHAALARTCAHEPAAGWPHWAQRHRTRLRRGGDWGALQALVRRCGAGCGGRGVGCGYPLLRHRAPLRARDVRAPPGRGTSGEAARGVCAVHQGGPAAPGQRGVARLDIVLVPDPDDQADQAVTEALPALIELREQGVIGAVGLGMNQWQVPPRAGQESDLDVVMLAGRWTLADRSGAPLLEACAHRNVSVLAAGPFNSGLLARAWPPDDAHFNYAPAPAGILENARMLALLSEQHGITLPQAALRFPLLHNAVACVVAGLGSPGHVRSAVDWLAAPVPETDWMQEVVTP